jgi:hypothetical protein
MTCPPDSSREGVVVPDDDLDPPINKVFPNITVCIDLNYYTNLKFVRRDLANKINDYNA